MIHLTGIEKRFGTQELFRDLDWHIKPGQRVGLIGPNGVGKSTVLRIIMDEETPDGGLVTIGKSKTLGYLRQDVALLAGRSVRDEVRLGLSHITDVGDRLSTIELGMATASGAALEQMMDEYGDLQSRFEELGGFQIENRVEEVLSGLGFKVSDFDADCGSLSGGWQMRVVLARLLLQEPDVLLLDEPTNHLDLESLVWLEGFLQTYPGSLVFISHDRWFLNRLASHIAELSRFGMRVFTGDFESYLQQKTEEDALLGRQQKNQQRRVAELERFITRFRAKATKAKQVQSRVKALAKMETIERRENDRTISFRISDAPKSSRVMLTLENAGKAYGDKIVHRGVDLELLRGRRIALVGPNGAGKTTLLTMLAGASTLTDGYRSLGFGCKPYYFAQHQVEALNLAQTVMQEADDIEADVAPTKLRGALGAFLFSEDDIDKRVGVLSGGEKARLSLVKMLLTPSNLLLLDEPTNHLDMASRSVLEDALAGFDGTIVLISHDRHFIDEVCNEIWEIDGGRITPFLGNYSEYQQRCAKGDRPQPLPLHQPRRKIAKPKKTAPEPKMTPKTVAPAEKKPVVDWSGGETPGVRVRKSKEEKRAQAERRKSLAGERRLIASEYKKAEVRVQSLEESLAQLEHVQADPGHYEDPEKVRTVAQDVARLRDELKGAYESWERAGAQLEAFDEASEF
jgi:ATP-binding cassette, subfamily F, member 3